MAIVYVNRDDRKQLELNTSTLPSPNNGHACACDGCEGLMPRFYFDLASRDKHIPDNAGKELETLHDADEHARKLIDKILFHLGDDDAAEWKVVISNDDHDAQRIVPFPISAMFRRQTDEQTKIGSGFVRVIGANSAVLHIRSQPRRTILGQAECCSQLAPARLRILRRGVAD